MPALERLAWLTGFTGSAGTAVVLSERAALFVDGRYTTQATNEVDARLFAIRHVMEQPVPEWLAAELSTDARLGYDPGCTRRTRLPPSSACVQAGGQAVPVDGNLIDRIWLDRPPPPIAPVVPHDDEFAGQPSREKRERIAEALRGSRSKMPSSWRSRIRLPGCSTYAVGTCRTHRCRSHSPCCTPTRGWSFSAIHARSRWARARTCRTA